jgi:hypothetical protein
MAFSVLISIGISLAISAALTVAQMLLFPKSTPQRPQTNQPTPPNGTQNERQPIPPLRVICGRVRTGGDIAFLEEKAGSAYQIIVHAAHRIEGYVQHWLHDEIITLDGSHDTSAPAHFGNAVHLEESLGLDAETAWALAVAAFPTIWTADHRGDGLSKIMLRFRSVSVEDFATVFPQGMPVATSLVDGARVYDPRDHTQDPDDPATWRFSRNLALIRLHHITHPSGLRRQKSEIYMADWIIAAEVCDQLVLNRDGEEEPRYWGGLSWKYRSQDSDAVSVGRKLDEAADLVPYTRGDGLIGVHAGRLVVPAIRLTADEITSIRFDANQSLAATVLAVRGHYIDPRNSWLPGDAAIYGDPYEGQDSTQRTKTIDNDAVQSHNHMQRLQKLAFTRANAARVTISVPYSQLAAGLMSSRFVTVHYPSRGLTEATIEMVGGTTLSLNPQGFGISFDGIVVPSTLYDFNASTEEGIPGAVVGGVEATGVPAPEDFDIEVKSESLASGATFSFVLASWTHFDDTFIHELQYQISDESVVPRSVLSKPGEDTLRTPSLEAGVVYRLRLRAWSAGAPSPWTGYLYTDDDGGGGGSPSDPTPPTAPTGFSAVAGSGIDATWTNPASANFDNAVLYISVSSDFSIATVEYTDRSGPSATPTHNAAWPSGGTYYLWVRAFNRIGAGSALVGPEIVTFF